MDASLAPAKEPKESNDESASEDVVKKIVYVVGAVQRGRHGRKSRFCGRRCIVDELVHMGLAAWGGSAQRLPQKEQIQKTTKVSWSDAHPERRCGRRQGSLY